MLWFLFSCGPAMVSPICEPGRSVSCSCTDGREGAQACESSGEWSDCACTRPTDSTTPDTATSLPATTTIPGTTTSPTDTGMGGTTAVPEIVDVYLLGGQSNMDGGGLVSALPPSLQIAQDDVQLYWSGRQIWQALSPASYWDAWLGYEHFGPEVTFGRTMRDAHPDQPLALIKHAVGGTALADCWNPGESRDDPSLGSCYSGFLLTVDVALAQLDAQGQEWRIAGMGWMQGESDAIEEAWALQYADNLAHFITRVREDVEAPELPFAVGLVDCQVHCPWRDVVREAQTEVAASDPLVSTVETADLPQNADQLHFDGSGMRTLGQRLAEALLSEPHSETSGPAFLISGSALSYYTGNFIVGYTFLVEDPITITDLGTLDSGWDGLDDGSMVALWDAGSGVLLTRGTVPAHHTQPSSIWGGWRFVGIEPLDLDPGEYIIGSQVYNLSADRYYHNVETSTAAGLRWGEGRHANGTGLLLPTYITTAEVSWFGPNFLFQAR